MLEMYSCFVFNEITGLTVYFLGRQSTKSFLESLKLFVHWIKNKSSGNEGIYLQEWSGCFSSEAVQQVVLKNQALLRFLHQRQKDKKTKSSKLSWKTRLCSGLFTHTYIHIRTRDYMMPIYFWTPPTTPICLKCLKSLKFRPSWLSGEKTTSK